MPDLSGADEVFLTLRAWHYWHTLGPLLDDHRDKMKPEAVWQIESGRDLSGDDIAGAMQQHGELMQRMRRFQEKYEFVVCAVNQVPPFDATIDWPHEIDGVKMATYLDWMKSAYRITSTFCPAISVPAGFTRRVSGGHPDRRALPRRFRRAAARTRFRAGDQCRENQTGYP